MASMGQRVILILTLAFCLGPDCLLAQTSQQIGVVEKSCSRCGRQVPLHSQSRENCPFCGAYWSAEVVRPQGGTKGAQTPVNAAKIAFAIVVTLVALVGVSLCAAGGVWTVRRLKMEILSLEGIFVLVLSTWVGMMVLPLVAVMALPVSAGWWLYSLCRRKRA